MAFNRGGGAHNNRGNFRPRTPRWMQGRFGGPNDAPNIGHRAGPFQMGRKLSDNPLWMDIIRIDRANGDYPYLPDIFTELNAKCFKGEMKESRVEVRWVNRRKDEPGNTYFWNGKVYINLQSENLNGLPRRDMIQVLLHEMIHAWIYFRTGNKERTHSDTFRKKMKEINKAENVQIHEVHMTHDQAMKVAPRYIYRCTGRCSQLGPYFGWLKRREDKAPSSDDVWYEDHMQNCGGEFEVFPEPTEEDQPGFDDIELEFGYTNQKPSTFGKSSQESTSVVKHPDSPAYVPFSGEGQCLGGNSQLSNIGFPSGTPGDTPASRQRSEASIIAASANLRRIAEERARAQGASTSVTPIVSSSSTLTPRFEEEGGVLVPGNQVPGFVGNLNEPTRSRLRGTYYAFGGVGYTLGGAEKKE